MSTGSLRVERTGPAGVVARVTLARPEVHNAFDAGLIAELRTAFALLAREGPAELRAVILAGDGPSFCAGADLAWMRAAMSLDTEGNEQDAMAMADMFETIDTCPVPVVARVHGSVLGGGMGLCAVSDLVIAESGNALRVHRDAARDPAVGHQPVRDRQDRRESRAGALPRRSPVRRDPGGPDRAGPRDRRGRRGVGRRGRRRPWPTFSPPARPRLGQPRRSSARSAGSATDRRNGTRRGSSPGSGRATRHRKASRRSPRSASRPGRRIDDP